MKNAKLHKAAKVISLMLVTILMLGMFSATEAEEVVIRQSQATLIVGDTFDLSLGNASEGATWTTNNDEVVTVEDGVVTAVALGEAVVTAALNGGEYKCHVEVVPKKEISMNQTYAVIGAGSGMQLKLEGAKGKTTWTSSDKNTASVNMNGKVATKASGTVTVTARNNDKDYTCVLFVRPAVKVTEKSVVIDAGTEKTINAISMNEKTKISFSVDNKNSVKVSLGKRAGNVTPIVIAGKKAGQATVTVKNNMTKETVKLQVTVGQSSAEPAKQTEGTFPAAANEQPVSDKTEDATDTVVTDKPERPEKSEDQKPAETKTEPQKPEVTEDKPAVPEEKEQKTEKEEKPAEQKPTETKPEKQDKPAENKPDNKTEQPTDKKDETGKADQTSEPEKPATEEYTISYETVTEDIPFQTEEQENAGLYKGTRTIARDGKVGKKDVTYEIKKDSNGNVVSKTKISENVTRSPKNEIYFVGTFVPEVTVEVVSADPTGMTGERNSEIDKRCEEQALWMAENGVQHSADSGMSADAPNGGYTESVGGWGSLDEAIAGTEHHGGDAVNHRDQYGFGVVKKTETLPDGSTKETYYAVSQGEDVAP